MAGGWPACPGRFLTVPGEMPVTRLNAWLKAASEP